MSNTFFDVNDPLAVKTYSASVQKALPKNSWFMKSGFVGEDPTKNIIVVKKDLVGKFGDQITYALRNQLRGYTTPGDQLLDKNIKALGYVDDRISLNQQRTGVSSGGRMSNKRVPYDVRKDARDAQVDYWGVHLDEEFIAKASGTLGVGQWETINPNVSGFDVEGAVDSDGNALRAPSANRLVVGSSTGLKANMLQTDTFSLDYVDKALMAVTRISAVGVNGRKMAPLRIGGKNVWVLLMDLTHAFDLKRNIGGRWGQMELAKLQSGMKDSALVQQALGAYESAAGTVLFFSHEGMPKFNDFGAGAVKAARSLLMGQNALTYAPGEKLGQDGLFTSWHEESRNHGNEVQISSGMIYGIQKTAFRTARGAADASREDFGVCAIDVAADY